MEFDMEDLTRDLDNVMFEVTAGRIYVAMKDLENIISDLKSLVKEYK